VNFRWTLFKKQTVVATVVFIVPIDARKSSVPRKRNEAKSIYSYSVVVLTTRKK